MRNENKIKGLTIVELLTVLAIIALLIGLLLPAISGIVNKGKEVKQRAQFATISIALESFRNDFGDYPNSDNLAGDYCGAQKLSEAIVGWDLFGFHPDSKFISDNGTTNGGVYYDGSNDSDRLKNIKERKGPYIEVEKAGAVRLGDLYTSSTLSTNAKKTYVLTDSYKRKMVNIVDRKVGMPILYYKAKVNRIDHLDTSTNNIYEFTDNEVLSGNGTGTLPAPWGDGTTVQELDKTMFYDQTGYLTNLSITTTSGGKLPYNKDSFILISAGKDGLYGTADDIFNFDKE